MLKICLVFWDYVPQYAYKRYAYKKKTCREWSHSSIVYFKKNSVTQNMYYAKSDKKEISDLHHSC